MTLPPPNDEYPYAQLNYAQARPARPGIITALGIIGIIVGSLTVLASLGGIMSEFMYMAMGKMNFPVPVVAPATQPAGTGGGTANSATTSTNIQMNVKANANVTPPATVNFNFNVDYGALILKIAEDVLSLGAAALVIFAGSLTLRDSPRSQRLYRLYLTVKLPLIVVAAFATWWMTSSMMGNLMTMNAGTPGAALMPSMVNWMAVGQAIFAALFPLAFVVGAFFVLRSNTAKTYYQNIATP